MLSFDKSDVQMFRNRFKVTSRKFCLASDFKSLKRSSKQYLNLFSKSSDESLLRKFEQNVCESVEFVAAKKFSMIERNSVELEKTLFKQRERT